MPRRGWLAAVAMLGILACGSSTESSQATSVVGTWSLQTINGTPLPFVIQQTGANTEQITSDVYRLVAGGVFTQMTGKRFTINGVVTTQSVPDAGIYVVNGNAVTVQYNSDGSRATAVWSGDTMTIAGGGFVSVYTR